MGDYECDVLEHNTSNRWKDVGATIGGWLLTIAGTSVLLGVLWIVVWSTTSVINLAVEYALPWLTFISQWGIAIMVLSIPLLLFRGLRGYLGTGYYVVSYVFGMTTWLMGIVYCLAFWGWTAVIIGFFIAGVGVVPVGLLAVLLNGEGFAFLVLLIMTIITFASRLVGIKLMEMFD